MTSKRLATAVSATILTAATSSLAFAQGSIDPGTSARQALDTETQTLDTQTLSQPTFRLLGYTFMWAQMAWMPGSSFQMPAAMFLPGDRRWGIR
jgi:hypothetical protein